MKPNHNHIKSTLQALADELGIKYTLYTDAPIPGKDGYHPVDGKSIKFWNHYPTSGKRIDCFVYSANVFLAPYGLYLTHHVLTKPWEREVDATIVDNHGQKVGCRATVDICQVTQSLLVVPTPTFLEI